MRKTLAAALFALAFASPALAAPCGPIPALPDTERRTEYTGVSSSTGPFLVNFQLYGDSTDVGNWLSVWVNGIQKTITTDFTVATASGPAIGAACLPITNAQVTFVAAQTGTIEIVGARRPRRASQFSENKGVTGHDLNQVISDLTATQRERWDLNTRTLRGLPSEVIAPLPAQATRASTIFGWDSSGNPTAVAPNIGLGTVIGPAVSVNGHIAVFNGTNGQLIADGGALSTTPANPSALVGCAPINGIATTIMRSDAAPGLNLAASCTYTGNHTLAPTSGVAMTITGAPSSLSRALDVTQTVAGAAGAIQQYNNILITDVANLGAFTGNGFNVMLNYGGGASQGNRQAIQAGVTLTSATNAGNPTHFYVAGQFNAQANSGDNGTNTGLGAKGAIIGLNPACTLQAGATNIAECAAIEATIQTFAGATVSEITGLQISDISGAGGVQGQTFHAAISMGNVAGSPGWKSGIAFDSNNYGAAPMDSTNGRAIEVIGGQTMKDFIYAPNLTVTSSFITGPGSNFVVDNLGNTQIAAAAQYSWVGRAKILSPGDGIIIMTNAAAADFTALKFGSNTAAFPSIKRNGTALNFRLADDTNDAPITAATATFIKSSIGTTSTDGVVLNNVTPALAGAQQYSPRIRLTGQGWRTNAGGASETVDWTIENRPVQSTADPFTTLVFSTQQNALNYTPHTALVLGGAAGAPVPPADSNQRFIVTANSLATSLYGVDNGGLVYAWCNACNGTLFGTAVQAPVDFWSNNVRRVRIDKNSTHVSYWSNTTPNQTGNTVAQPALTACGTAPAISAISSDASGTVTMGTAAPAGCVITFNVAYTQAPICRVTWRVNIASMQYAVSAAAITLTQTATSSNVIDYTCDGS